MPPKRKKKKQASQARIGLKVDGNEALKISKDIEEGLDVSEETLMRLLDIGSACPNQNSATTKGGCKGLANNPCCLCGIIPSKDSYRMQGLWSKTASKNIDPTLQDADPTSCARRSTVSPIGLTNLGNTCYFNSVIQCLFAIDEFKYAILEACMSPLEGNEVLQRLCDIFVTLECGPRNYVDPEPLISALRLDSSVQQDGQEFMKLFLTLLETACEAIPMLGQKIASMFKGKSGYQTRCLSCENLSHSSNRFDDFCELDIPIKGYTSLEESMGALLAPEILEGDNQYYCDHCGQKQDAARQLIVKDLPPVLCLSLQRFVFDLQKMDRVKASDKFSFPMEIDAYMVTHDAQTKGIMYDLEGILLHKGPSARQGHYVAHVAVNRKGSRSSKPVWYRFDDTVVTKLDKGSAGHSDHGWKAKPTQQPNIKQGTSSTKPKGDGEMKDHHDVDLIDLSRDQDGLTADENQRKEPVEDVKDVVSSNAYLLVYKRRPSSSLTGKRVAKNTEILEWLDKKKGEMLKEYEGQCQQHQKIVEEARGQIETRRDIVRDIVDSSKTVEGSGRFIVASWLQKWADAEPRESISEVNNDALLCNHGKLDPSRIQASKRLAPDAWAKIVSLHGGSPELGLGDICKACLKTQLDSIVTQEDVAVNRERFLELSHSINLENKSSTEDEENTDIASYYVGRHWLRNWRNRKGLSMGGTSPTDALVCPHSKLVPNYPDKPNKRVAISEEFWSYLKRSWFATVADKDRKSRFKKAESGGNVENGKKRKLDKEQGTMSNSADRGGGLNQDISKLAEFPSHCNECPICKEQMLEELSVSVEIGGRRDQERNVLKHLVSTPQSISLVLDALYKLVPSLFMQEWREYIAAGRSVQGAIEPPKLKPYMDSVACLSHACDSTTRICYQIPHVVNRRGRWMALNEKGSAFEIISETDWCELWKLYGSKDIPFGPQGISVYLSPDQDNNAGQNGDGLTDNDITKPSSAQDATSNKATSVHLATAIDVCYECIKERSDAIRASKLNFEGKEILIEIVLDEDTAIRDTAQQACDEVPANHQQHIPHDSQPHVLSVKERKSKRARKGRSPVIVDSTTTLENLKLRIFEALGVHPGNIRAFAKGKEMLDASKSMMDYEIFPLEEVRIVDTHLHDSEDLASIFPDGSGPRAKSDDQEKEGFSGTALVG
ncbi:hypothetical protein M9435_003948 [Picochlorum sp. BPE23]|nr:hypothetical protein M9435_003948 [Picochlorum sp. BPE23]